MKIHLSKQLMEIIVVGNVVIKVISILDLKDFIN